MASTDNYMGKDTIRHLILEAREMIRWYVAENARNPSGRYEYGTPDWVAIRLFERASGIFFTGCKLDGKNAILYAQKGGITDRNRLEYALAGSEVLKLEGIEGTTVSRFARSICELVEERRSNPELAKFLDQHTKHSSSAKSRLKQYSGNIAA